MWVRRHKPGWAARCVEHEGTPPAATGDRVHRPAANGRGTPPPQTRDWGPVRAAK